MKRLPVLLLIVVGLFCLPIWSISAQDAKLSVPLASYLASVSAQLKALDTDSGVVSDYLGGRNAKTKDDTLKAKARLDKLTKDLDSVTPPVQALGLHAQLGFALKDCAQFADTASQSKGKTDVNAFSISVFLIIRNQCADGMRAVTLRMLDIYSAAGVMPPK